MILYDEQENVGLDAFGIQIPIRDSRARKTFAHLKTHPYLGPRIRQWHTKPTTTPITRKDLARVHSRAYLDRLFSDQLEKEILHTYELIDHQGNYYRYDPQHARQPLSGLLDRALRYVAGTYTCGRIALERGFCFFFGGGMHHAQENHGNGFCLLNDIVIAVRKLQAERQIQTAWVIDVDVHKGDGTAALTTDDPSINTLSIHMARGWPLDGRPVNADGHPNPSFISSDVDIPIDTGQETVYLDRLAQGLNRLASFHNPDVAFIVSGADPYAGDTLPSTRALRLSGTQLMERDRLIYHFLQARQIPRAYLMAGGYGSSVWKIYAQFLEWALMDQMGVAAT